MSTEQQRQAWRALDAARTPGEWEAMEFAKGNGIVINLGNGKTQVIDVLENATAADAAFIAAASTAVPALLADVERLTGEARSLRLEVAEWEAVDNGSMRDLETAQALAKTSLDMMVLANNGWADSSKQVAAITAERDTLAAELATVRAQLARFEEIERYYQDRNNVIAETGSKRNSWQQP